MGTHHIDGQDVEAFTLPPSKVECDRLAVRRRHLGQVRTYGARMGGSLVLQTGLGMVYGIPVWYMYIEMANGECKWRRNKAMRRAKGTRT